MDIINKYPDKPWDWDWISNNPNITMDMINQYPDKPWDWGGISRNPNITMDIINQYPDKPWDWLWISRNPKIIMESFDPEREYSEHEWRILSRSIFKIEERMKLDYENICIVSDLVGSCELMIKTELCRMLGVDIS